MGECWWRNWIVKFKDMKKIITLLFISCITAISFGQVLNAPKGIKYKGTLLTPSAAQLNRVDATSSIQGQLNTKITADYVIEKIGSTYFARPSGSYTAYSNADVTVVLNAAIGQLTSGGRIFIRNGEYLGLGILTFSYSKIVIEGEDKLNTHLKIKNSFDVANANIAFINFDASLSNITFKNLNLDGNDANQVYRDNNASVTARISCFWIWDTDNVTIDNCYIHNWTRYGIATYAGRTIVTNCLIDEAGWNCITFGQGTFRCKAENNTLKNAGDVGITIYGNENTVMDNMIADQNGSYGTVGTHWGIGIENGGTAPANNIIAHNRIIGAHMGRGIGEANGSTGTIIKDNVFDSLLLATAVCINLTKSTDVIISGNKITNYDYSGIGLNGVKNSKIENNEIIGSYPLAFYNSSGTYATDNLFTGNVFTSTTDGVYINSGCNNNTFISNTIIGNGGLDINMRPGATGIVSINNLGVNNAPLNTVIAATSDGLTTGLIPIIGQDITVTSANANNIICLPTTGVSTVGYKITGQVTANGCELRVIAAQATTVYINGVTTNVEAAIPASSTFEIRCIDATHWILKVWGATGTYSAPIPDAV
jgi:parallel beta-helix repeat protein